MFSIFTSSLFVNVNFCLDTPLRDIASFCNIEHSFQ